METIVFIVISDGRGKVGFSCSVHQTEATGTASPFIEWSESLFAHHSIYQESVFTVGISV